MSVIVDEEVELAGARQRLKQEGRLNHGGLRAL
jgi:hypothetical protein